MRWIGVVGLIVMAGALIHGFTGGDLSSEGRELVGLAWGRVSLLDIYTGVLVFGAWIVWREGSLRRSLPWLLLLVVLGNFGVAPYLVWISRRHPTVAEALTGGRSPN